MGEVSSYGQEIRALPGFQGPDLIGEVQEVGRIRGGGPDGPHRVSSARRHELYLMYWGTPRSGPFVLIAA